MNEQQAMQPFIERRQKNLAYFKAYFPDIYKHFVNYQLTQYQVNILTETQEVDLLHNGRSIYNNAAKQTARKEVSDFREIFHEGSIVESVTPPFPGDYDYPRFAHAKMDKLVRSSSLNRENFDWYHLGDFYPLIVFLGCGLGYHIQEMVDDHHVENLIVVEPELDKFAASLYSVDWYRIGAKYDTKKGRLLHFILGADYDEMIVRGVIWNKLIELCPIFPATTLFFNHQRSPFFDQVSENINKDMVVFLLSWGHYDDELRQLNNSLHNFHQKVPELPKSVPKAHLNIPVAVIAGGPSLDERIELLKPYADKVFIISAGTSLRSLCTLGLKPDIHVELESDLLTYNSLKQVDKDFLKGVAIIGPTQLNPLVYTLFDKKALYYKNESSLSKLFGETGLDLQHATPTCTNAAVALVLHYGFRHVYLFGTDFGFANPERHHAKGAIYYEENIDQAFKDDVDFTKTPLVIDVDVHGEEIYTKPTYYTSKRKVEQVAQIYKNQHKKGEVFNCADGAKIDYTDWLSPEDMVKKLNSTSDKDKKVLIDYFFSDSRSIQNLSSLQKKLDYMQVSIGHMRNDIKDLINKYKVSDLRGIVRLCFAINHYLESHVQTNATEFYFFLRGMIRHYLYTLYTHSFSINDNEKVMEFYNLWRRTFLQDLAETRQHFTSVTSGKFDLKTDPWVYQSMSNPEDMPIPEDVLS